jgi:transketolase
MKLDKPYNSQRGYFSWYLYDAMLKDSSIFLLTGDLGYKMFDNIASDFPSRFINTGAAEQTLLDMAVGLSLSGKIAVCYSITPFLLARGYETIRNYINHENLPVKLVASGRDKDYHVDGYSHDASDAKDILALFDSIVEYWPQGFIDMSWVVIDMLYNGKPSFVSLKR